MTTSTSTRHEWLPRVSDYHNGDGSDAERDAVEAHLRTCADCQEALTMYRRFYSLLQSPLRLGAPGAAFSEDTPTMYTRTPTQPPPRGRPPYGQPRPRRKLVAGIAAGLAAAVVVAGFLAVLATRGTGPSIAGTPVPHHTATTAPQATDTATVSATPAATTPPTPSPFVCANPAGSQMVYAYIRGDGNTYAVMGCNAPKQLLSASYATPIAWSPSNRYLAVTLQQDFPNGARVQVIDTQTGAIVPTGFTSDFGSTPNVGTTGHIFFGWLDDNTFLGAIAPLVNGPANVEAPGTSTLVRVDLHTGKQTAIGTIPGWVVFSGSFRPGGVNVRLVANGHYLFYAAYSGDGSTAFLHRYDLVARTDAKFVSLGMYANGGCQGTSVCGWSAGWDVSPDGSHIVYHNPGPTSSPSDTNDPADTPLYYANVDGSSATRLFGSKLAPALTTPTLSPDGKYVITASSFFANGSYLSQTWVEQLGGGYQTINGGFQAWRGDSQAMVLSSSSGNTGVIYTLATGTTTPLEANSNYYLWGN